jgi:hypothetical protein
MKHLLTAIACCLAMAGSAQSDGYPFNPDSDGDGLITVEDLLAVLSDFGLAAEVETCYKGDICVFYAQCSQGVPIHQGVDSNCGTIIGQLGYQCSNGGTIVALDLSNEGSSEGDVLHFYLDSYSSNAPGFIKIYSLIDNNWSQIHVISSAQFIGRTVFNGVHWEALD